MAESKVVFLMNQTSVPAGQAEDGENYAGDPNGEATRLPISAAPVKDAHLCSAPDGRWVLFDNIKDLSAAHPDRRSRTILSH